MLSMATAVVLRFYAVRHARLDKSGGFSDIANKDLFPFNSPWHLARDIADFSVASRRRGGVALLCKAMVMTIYVAISSLAVFLISIFFLSLS